MPFSTVKSYRVITPSCGTTMESSILKWVTSVVVIRWLVMSWDLLLCRILAAVTERLSTINVSVKPVRHLNRLKWAPGTSFSLALMSWRTRVRRRTDVLSLRFDSTCQMGEKRKPVNRRSSVQQTLKFHKWIFIGWISTFKRRFSVNRISKANCWAFRRRLTWLGRTSAC